ncbi:MAG: hypothetical protein L6R42_006501 [Xanthoria sp. 1 TBL-2021]|nr:MAG: hypothetical protein L6R42_006501 [Xanthoria sp. 1 TBL-2021]
MLLRWLLFCFVFATPLIQALPNLEPRVDQGIAEQGKEGCKPRVDQGLFEKEDKVKCIDYSTCSIKGKEYWNILQTTLRQPQMCDRDDLELFEEHYFAEYDTSMMSDPDLRQALENRNIEATRMDTWEVSGLDPDTLTRDNKPAYYNIFDTQNGIIVAEGNWKFSDSQQVLEWSEIMYQTWRLAEERADILAGQDKNHLPGGPISNLRAVVQHIITNEVTRSVMKAAYDANGWVPGYDGPDEWRPWTEQTTEPFFFGLMGTDNVKGTVWLLNDHADEIGRKEISVIWTRWHLGNPDIWIDIAPWQSPQPLPPPLGGR